MHALCVYANCGDCFSLFHDQQAQYMQISDMAQVGHQTILVRCLAQLQTRNCRTALLSTRTIVIHPLVLLNMG